jgi:hypothetical protein
MESREGCNKQRDSVSWGRKKQNCVEIGDNQKTGVKDHQDVKELQEWGRTGVREGIQ